MAATHNYVTKYKLVAEIAKMVFDYNLPLQASINNHAGSNRNIGGFVN